MTTSHIGLQTANSVLTWFDAEYDIGGMGFHIVLCDFSKLPDGPRFAFLQMHCHLLWAGAQVLLLYNKRLQAFEALFNFRELDPAKEIIIEPRKKLDGRLSCFWDSAKRSKRPR